MAILTVFLAVLLTSSILALPEGPPVDHHPEVCTTMSPGHHHGNNTATGPAPYVIVVSTNYTAGEPIQVTVRANPRFAFTGFFVQARSQSDSAQTNALGAFSNIPEGSQVLACTSAAGGWAHNNKLSKTEMTASWTPPSNNPGTVAFQATIVKGPKSVYWEGVKSAPLTYSASAAPNLVSSSMSLVIFVVIWVLMVRL